jgi:hypothetical protein
MSKKLGNIPTQKKMSEEQEQTFTNGINKGRKLEREKMKAEKLNKKIHREFTIDEFDEFTMELQSLGASHERGNIIEELKRRRKHLFEAQQAMGSPGGEPQAVMLNYVMGMSMAIRFIEQLPDWEDNCGCSECGAI